jgi:hypothetical protein
MVGRFIAFNLWRTLVKLKKGDRIVYYKLIGRDKYKKIPCVFDHYTKGGKVAAVVDGVMTVFVADNVEVEK